jgi:hypothetical protein
MTDLELFKEWCKLTIEMEEERRNQMILDPSIQKWEIQKEFCKSLMFECQISLQALDKFEKFKENGL